MNEVVKKSYRQANFFVIFQFFGSRTIQCAHVQLHVQISIGIPENSRQTINMNQRTQLQQEKNPNL